MSASARGTSGSTPAAEDPAERAREIALRLLNHSPRSAAQLREGMVSREVAPDIADEVIERYREVGLLDDASLSAAIVRTRHRERGKSRRAILGELRRKGFGQDDIDSALEQITDDDEQDAARTLAVKRWNQLAGVDRDKRVRRVVGMLGRKGYAPSDAFALVREFEDADNSDT
ncbi:regulatory protein RecX [Demequina sp. SO4-13]|uniref:regulatory protein RecX n=1 Tax=Demequina sp. SO4-13 TaxID=3401027 RepID=UPI003AF9ECD6